METETPKYNKNGVVEIHLENYNFISGEEIHGTVYISLREQIAPATLYLIFRGKEETH